MIFNKFYLWLSRRSNTCFVLAGGLSSHLIVDGEIRPIKEPNNLDPAIENCLKLLDEHSQAKNSVQYFLRMNLEEIFWKVYVPMQILTANGIDTDKYRVIPIGKIRGVLSGLRFESKMLQKIKKLLGLTVFFYSLKAFKSKSNTLVIKESVAGFRYQYVMDEMASVVDVGTCSFLDIFRHPWKILIGKVLFVGAFEPLFIPRRLSTFDLSMSYNFLATSKTVARSIDLFEYVNVYSHDKTHRHGLFLYALQSTRTNLTLCQHGVIGPAYFNGLRKGLLDTLLKFEKKRKWPLLQNLHTPQKKPACIKALLFFNEFLCDQHLQFEIMNASRDHGYKVYFKDRPKKDFFAASNRFASDEKIKQIESFCDVNENSGNVLAVVFHSSVVYDALSLGYRVMFVNNFLFDKAEIKDAGIASVTSEEFLLHIKEKFKRYERLGHC